MRALKRLSYVLIALVALLVLVTIVGAFLPEQHTVSASVELPASQARVWQMITDVEAQTRWRTGFKSVEYLPEQNGHPCWMERQNHMRAPLCADLSAPPTTRVVRVADSSLPYGGTWKYDLQPTGSDSSRLTITEDGTVGPALWRFIDFFILKEDGNIKRYEADLLKAVRQ